MVATPYKVHIRIYMHIEYTCVCVRVCILCIFVTRCDRTDVCMSYVLHRTYTCVCVRVYIIHTFECVYSCVYILWPFSCMYILPTIYTYMCVRVCIIHTSWVVGILVCGNSISSFTCACVRVCILYIHTIGCGHTSVWIYYLQLTYVCARTCVYITYNL